MYYVTVIVSSKLCIIIFRIYPLIFWCTTVYCIGLQPTPENRHNRLSAIVSSGWGKCSPRGDPGVDPVPCWHLAHTRWGRADLCWLPSMLSFTPRPASSCGRWTLFSVLVLSASAWKQSCWFKSCDIRVYFWKFIWRPLGNSNMTLPGR